MEAGENPEPVYRMSSTIRKCDKCGNNDWLYIDYPFQKPMPRLGLVDMVGDICALCRSEIRAGPHGNPYRSAVF